MNHETYMKIKWATPDWPPGSIRRSTKKINNCGMKQKEKWLLERGIEPQTNSKQDRLFENYTSLSGYLLIYPFSTMIKVRDLLSDYFTSDY